MAGSLPIAKIKKISKLVEEKGVEEARKELISSGMITRKEIEENQEKANARETYVNPYEKKMRDIATGFKLVSDIGVGALKGAESIADAVSTGIGYGASGIQSLWDKEGAEKTKDYWKKLTEVDVIEDTLGKAVDNVYTKNSWIGRGNNTLDTADSLIEGTSEMIPSIILGNGAAGAVGKLGLAAKATSAAETANKAAKVYQLADKATRSVANTIPFMIQSTGSGINEALDEGTSYDDATKYGVASGIAEGAIEGFSGGIGGIASNKILSKVFSNPEVSSALGKFVSSNIGKFVTKAGDIAIDAAGEGLEEVISGIINPYIKRLTYDEQAELANSEELIQQFTGGAIGSLLMKAGYSAANSDFSVKNTINNVKEKINSKKTKIDTNTESINNSSNIEQNNTQKNYAELPQNTNFNTNQNLSNTYESENTNTIPNVSDFQTNINQSIEDSLNIAETASSSSNKQQIIDIINSNKNFDSSMKQNLINGVQQINNLDNSTYNSFLNQIEEINQEYNSFATIKKEAKVKYNSKIVEEATNTVPSNKQGKRTKSEWLKVAEQIGINVENKAELQQYAEKSWNQLHPNIADNLNRQGQKYVKFTKQEWINAVTKSSNLKYSITGSKNNSNLFNENKIVNENIKGYSDEIKYDSENFAKQVDSVKNGTFPQRDMLTLGRTPKVLRELGLNDLPITMTQKHLETIMNETGKYKNSNYHGLGEDIVKKLPEALNNPLDILKSSSKEDSIVLTTDLSDKQDRTIIASIKIDGKGNVNDVRIDTNVMTSAYGRNNYDKFMQDNIKAGNLLYDIDQGIIKKIDKKTVGERLQLPMRDSSDVRQNSSENISINNIIPQNEKYATSNEKKINPLEISNLTTDNVKTTPKLPTRNYNTDSKSESDFYNNLMSKTNMLNDNVKEIIKNSEDIKYYQGVTNEQALAEAYNKLNSDGEKETIRWFNKDLNSKSATVSATEVAEGWILLKQYQDAGDYQSAVNVAKKMRDMATKSAQALQAYNIQSRLTPEGMVQYAQSELTEAYQIFSKNKTKEWIQEHRSEFDLKPEEVKAIMDKTLEAQKLPENSREKKIKLAEINKIMSNKLPPEKGAGIKTWMRISMLFNPKTLRRNFLGNAVIAPVNFAGDFVGTIADKALAKKTGIRTTGNTNLVNYAKGFKKGLFESYDDFKRGINTREVSGNRFEIGSGKSYKDKGLGKILNKVDNLLNFLLDVGDRPFYEATFTNSINNQLVLNDTDVVTQDMIDIATNEALSRTWQDDNEYTNFILNFKHKLNKADAGTGYGLGEAFIAFAKTPGNLTKAIIDYSPAGVVSSLLEGNNVRKALGRGDLTAKQQHDFVQKLGKATAGSALYILGYALAKAGFTSGESDEDKDVANFMKNTLGVSNYSIKIGGKTFTYDWAQPVAAPIAMMANLVNKSDEEVNLLEKITSTLNIPFNAILEQSFMEGIQTVFTNQDGVAAGLLEAVAELPSRAIPTLSKQIADSIDTTQRTTYEKGKPIQTAINKVIAKLPVASKSLTPVADTLGNDIKKYGGETNKVKYLYNVFLNPANVNSDKKNKVGEEIYKVYEKTGDKTIFPRQASYSQTIDGNNFSLTSEERYEYQKKSGKYVEKVVKNLLKSDTYKKLSAEEKAKILTEVSSDSNEIAKEALAKEKNLNYTRAKTDVKIDDLITKGLDYGNAYIYKAQINSIKGTKASNGKTISGSTNGNKAKYIMNMNTDSNQKNKLLSLLNDSEKAKDVTVSDLSKVDKSSYTTFFGLSGTEDSKGFSQKDKYLMLRDMNIKSSELDKYFNEVGNIKSEKDDDGKTITDSKKIKVLNYICDLDIEPLQKITLFAKSGYTDDTEELVFEYLSEKNLTTKRKLEIMSMLYD